MTCCRPPTRPRDFPRPTLRRPACNATRMPRPASRIPAACQPAGWQEYPALHITFLFMTALLLGVFAFFGGHTAFWLFRSAYLYFHDSKKFREAKVVVQQDDEMYHAVRAVRAVSAFPGRDEFPSAGGDGDAPEVLLHRLGQGHVLDVGGAETARALHHFGAIITFPLISASTWPAWPSVPGRAGLTCGIPARGNSS